MRKEVVDSFGERWPALLNRQEAALYLGVSKSTLSHLKSEGTIRTVAFGKGRQPMYRRTELDELIASLEYHDGFCAANEARKRDVD